MRLVVLLSSSYDARRKLPSKEEDARDMRWPGISAGDQSSSAARYKRPEDAVGGSSDPAGVQGRKDLTTVQEFGLAEPIAKCMDGWG